MKAIGDKSRPRTGGRPAPAGVLGMTALMALGLLIMLSGLIGVLS